MGDRRIDDLINYGIKKKLLGEPDRIWAYNQILMILQADSDEELAETAVKHISEEKGPEEKGPEEKGPEETGPEEKGPESGESGMAADQQGDGLAPDSKERDAEEIAVILDHLCAAALKTGALADDGVVSRDLFDTKLMGVLTPRPSQVRSAFMEKKAVSPEAATDWFYDFSRDTNYIRRDRIRRDVKWVTRTEYGNLDITINLSKPEKDPKAIAAARNLPQSSYPKCQLCAENEGYAGRLNHPARENHRIIPITINQSPWYFQYSPYVYYNEHCIVFNSEHVPMKIDAAAFRKLLDFVKLFPHYFVGSNADLPIVGGSILSHDHFQGGHYTFAMEKAETETPLTCSRFPEVEACIVKWPLSVIRLRSENDEVLARMADEILTAWRKYSDPDAFIYAETDGEPHNTITPIARRRGEAFELDLVLRNNITTEEHPLGLFHPHAELHHIKKENIGLIEVMGLAVLPARLKEEMELLADALVNGADVRADGRIAAHADWAEFLQKQYIFDRNNVDDILKEEIGKVFMQVLEHAGVYKRTAEGKAAFLKFCSSVGLT